MFHWWNLIRSGEKLQISTYLDSEIFADVRDLPWISRISTAREEKHRHHGESHDCTGPRPPRPVWNSVKPGFNQHFPHEFVWKLRLKHVKTQIWWLIMFISLIHRYFEGISYLHTQLNGWWFMNCFTMFHMFHGGSLIWMFFWWNRETTKSGKTAPGSQSLTKAYRPVMASEWKNGSKNGEIKGGLEHPTKWRFSREDHQAR